MISCEEFESLYLLVNSPEIEEHRRRCPFCAKFTQEYAFLRRSFPALAFQPAPIGFDIRLKHRLAEIEYGKVREWKVFPRAAAFATGMALVMIAGGIYMRQQNIPIQQMAQNPPAEEQPVNIVDDTTSVETDTIKVVPTSPWGDFRRMEAVSAQP